MDIYVLYLPEKKKRKGREKNIISNNNIMSTKRFNKFKTTR